MGKQIGFYLTVEEENNGMRRKTITVHGNVVFIEPSQLTTTQLAFP